MIANTLSTICTTCMYGTSKTYTATDSNDDGGQSGVLQFFNQRGVVEPVFSGSVDYVNKRVVITSFENYYFCRGEERGNYITVTSPEGSETRAWPDEAGGFQQTAINYGDPDTDPSEPGTISVVMVATEPLEPTELAKRIKEDQAKELEDNGDQQGADDTRREANPPGAGAGVNSPAFQQLANQAVEGATSACKKSALQQLSEVVSKFNLAVDIAGDLQSTAAGAVGGLISGQITGAIQSAVSGLGVAGGGFAASIQAAASRAGLGAVDAIAQKVFTAINIQAPIGANIAQITAAIGNSIKQAVSSIFNVFKPLTSLLTSLTQNVQPAPLETMSRELFEQHIQQGPDSKKFADVLRWAKQAANPAAAVVNTLGNMMGSYNHANIGAPSTYQLPFEPFNNLSVAVQRTIFDNVSNHLPATVKQFVAQNPVYDILTKASSSIGTLSENFASAVGVFSSGWGKPGALEENSFDKPASTNKQIFNNLFSGIANVVEVAAASTLAVAAARLPLNSWNYVCDGDFTPRAHGLSGSSDVINSLRRTASRELIRQGLFTLLGPNTIMLDNWKPVANAITRNKLKLAPAMVGNEEITLDTYGNVVTVVRRATEAILPDDTQKKSSKG